MKNRIVNEIFVERFNLLREERNVSLEMLDNEIGISKASLSKYANGIHVPNSDIIKRLCDYFGVTADYMLGLEDSRTSAVAAADELPAGYVQIVQDAIKYGITEDEFRSFMEMAIRLKRG